MSVNYSSPSPFPKKSGTSALIALIVCALAFGSISCPAHLDDVNVKEAVVSGVDFSFVIWKIDIPRRLTAGDTLEIPLTLMNNGNKPWISSPGSEYFLSYHLKYFTEGYDTSAMFRGAHTPLPAYVGTGEMVETEFRIEPPEKPGAYYIAIDIGRSTDEEPDSVFWFSREGWKTKDCLVEVEQQ